MLVLLGITAFESELGPNRMKTHAPFITHSYNLGHSVTMTTLTLLGIGLGHKGPRLVGPVGLDPATKALCLPLQVSLLLSNLWAGLSLHESKLVLAVKSLHVPTTVGFARDYRMC